MKNPYIAGSWVRGENFFGRTALINEIVEGRRHYVWIAGTRRFGKTSLLKQIEYLTTEGPYAADYISLFWDLQGSQDLSGLKESLLESVEDAEDRFEAIAVVLDELEEMDIFGILRMLRRKAKENSRVLLLLCDEAEELINIERNNPEVLPKLRRVLQRGENMITVLTATKRLSKLETSTIPETSPFLHGFVPPVYLARLEDDEAQRLINLGNIDDDVAVEIMDKTNNHPYLIQLICKRLVESVSLVQVIEEVCSDEMISHFFSVDFQYLDAKEREILLHILSRENLSLKDLENQFQSSKAQLVRQLFELTQLGFINHRNSLYHISNYFFRVWLEREKEKLFTESSLKRAAPTGTVLRAPRSSSWLPEVGDLLGQHEILEKIGSGGMGVVYKGRDVQLDRMVALKVLLPDLLTDQDFKERFLHEARAASSMNHPNIATVYQIGKEGDIYFISMEFVEGESLKGWRSAHVSDLQAQLAIARQALLALGHAHGRKVVHRDVKSDNLMVTREGVLKVMDFGLAKSLAKVDKHLTRTGTTLGTLSYMSPEQASGLETDHRTDIFSLGVVFYELLTGVLPFTGDFELSVLYAIMNEEVRPLRELNPGIPERLEVIVGSMLEKDKSKRCQSVEQVLQVLDELHL